MYIVHVHVHTCTYINTYIHAFIHTYIYIHILLNIKLTKFNLDYITLIIMYLILLGKLNE